jgi:hypothetical protein
MKIRTGFVSNSSSTSFTVPTTAYKDVFELAQHMITCRGWDSDDKLIEKIDKDKVDGIDPNSNVCFSTCNFDTYICRIEDYYVVSTCNNHSFGNFIEISYDYPKKIKEKAKNAGYEYDERFYCEFNLPEEFSFWYPELGVFGEEIDYATQKKNENLCDKHSYYDLFRVDGKIVCKGCLKEKFYNE